MRKCESANWENAQVYNWKEVLSAILLRLQFTVFSHFSALRFLVSLQSGYNEYKTSL